MIKALIWFSAGATSAIAYKLAIQRYGIEHCKAYYFDIASAHSDNDRFIKDCEKTFGLTIERVHGKYEDQFDVIEQRRYINGPGGALCSTVLKKELRYKIQRQYPAAVQIFGFEYSLKEINRAVRFIDQFPDVNPRFPLIEHKLTKRECLFLLERAGIKLPKMYELGYNNNNCIGCVKGGQAYWNKIKVDFPEVFERMSETEDWLGRSCINGVFLKNLPESTLSEKPIAPDCGSICEIKFEDILDNRSSKILKDPKFLRMLYKK